MKKMGFVGKTGPAVYYWLGNTYCVRSLPSKYKQTKATRAKALVFGRASRMARIIRQILHFAIPNPTDKKMQTRLVSGLFRWLNASQAQPNRVTESLRLINRFTFNDKGSEVLQRWKISLLQNYTDQGINLVIPAFVPENTLQAPAHTLSVKCRMAMGVLDLKTNTSTGSCSGEFDFDYNGEEVETQILSLKKAVTKGSLILAALSLEYTVLFKGAKSSNTNKAFMPAGIVHAMIVAEE